MSRYVLRVLTGKEQTVCADIRQLGFPALAPIENRLIRSGGRWEKREYCIFPGYVFVDLERCTTATHVRLLRIEFVSRLLCDGKGEPVPLTAEESAWIDTLADVLVEPSTVWLSENGGYRVTGGALAALADKIVALDCHARRALVKTQVAGHPITLAFSIHIER